LRQSGTNSERIVLRSGDVSRASSRGKVCNSVKADDRRTEDGGGGDQTESNVVRLPREWIGPIEELVPFGPSARSSKTSLASVAGDDLIPPGPDDFWSEDSAAVQDALQAPSAARRPNVADTSGGPVSSVWERALRNTRRLHRPRRATAVVGLIAITTATPVIVIAADRSSAPKIGAHRSVAATTKPSADSGEAANTILGGLAHDTGAASELSAHMRRSAASQRPRRRTPVRAAAHHVSNPPRAKEHRNPPPPTEGSSAASQTQDPGTGRTTPLVMQPVVLTPTGSSTRSQAPATSSSSGRGGGSSRGSSSNTQNDLPTPGGLPPP
jgi:hypothetical protein